MAGYNRTSQARLFYGSDEGPPPVLAGAASDRKRSHPEKLDGIESLRSPRRRRFLRGRRGYDIAVPEGKMYSVSVSQNLQTEAWDEPLPVSAATKFRLTKEAWKAVYAPAVATSAVSPEDRAGK